MQSTQVQHVDPHADPHDDIVAILRSEKPAAKEALKAPDPSELHINLNDRAASAASLPPIEAELRPTTLNDNKDSIPVRKRPARRFLRFLMTVAVGVAATLAWQSYGEAARQMLATWAPQLVAPPAEPIETASAPEQADPVAEQGAEQAAPAQPVDVASATADAPATPQAAAPAQAAPPPATQAAAPAPDLTPMIEEMSREIASLREAVEELKSGQQKLGRDIAKAAEQETKRKVATPAPRPAAASDRDRDRDRNPPPPPPQAARQVIMPPPSYTQPYTPPPPPGGYASVPRPPLPLR